MYVRNNDTVIISFVDNLGRPVRITGLVVSQAKWGLKVPLLLELKNPVLEMEITNDAEAQ